MFDLFAKSTFDGHHSRKFLPEGSLTRLVTEGSIRLELEDKKLQRDPIVVDLVPYICSKATKLFATAVYMKSTRKTLLRVMHQLHSNDFTDEDLPMQLVDGKSRWTELRWSKDRMEDFYDAQWAFLAPVFSPSQVYYELSSDCILPLLDLEAKDVGVFAFSSMTKGRIHEDHISRTQWTSNECFAVKQISRNCTAKEMDRFLDRKELRRVSASDHPHIVCLIAAVTKGSNIYYISPWADGGNLRDFWGQDKRLSLNKDGVTESVSQLRGLSDALKRLNRCLFRPHGHLKPENILVFPNNKSSIGHLNKGDWGLAEKYLEPRRRRQNQMTTRYGTRLYEAPEAVIQRDTRSLCYDTWALGCVALEHLVWLLYGEKEHDRFVAPLAKADVEGFHRSAGERPIVNPDVVRWMEHISAHFPLGTGVGDLVKVLRTKMLVIDLPPKPGTEVSDQPINGPYRADTWEINFSLDRILIRLKYEDDYCFSDRPYDGLGGPEDDSAITQASSSGESD